MMSGDEVQVRLRNVATGGIVIAAFTGLTCALLGFWLGTIAGRSDSACPAPTYDVDRVVKMHEENRKCEAELEEARDNVLVCGRLLKRALE